MSLRIIKGYELLRNTLKDRNQAHNPKVAGSNPAPATKSDCRQTSTRRTGSIILPVFFFLGLQGSPRQACNPLFFGR